MSGVGATTVPVARTAAVCGGAQQDGETRRRGDAGIKLLSPRPFLFAASPRLRVPFSCPYHFTDPSFVVSISATGSDSLKR
jgi:hypothetical protein